jgi:hypothetical protein
MKKTFTLLLATLLFYQSSKAKIWRCNNNTGVTADFSTVQAAHNGAAAGDTIHLEPSLVSYGDLTMSKRLVIIGTGQFQNENPGIQYDPKSPYIGNVSISNTGANNSVLMVRFAGNISINTGVTGVSLVNCASTTANGHTSCAPGQVILNNADNIVIKNSWVSNIQMDNSCNNIVISNNIVGNTIRNDGSCDGIITNNIIHAVSGGACGNNAGTIHNCVINNNIWNALQNTSFSNCNLTNNMAPNGNLPAGNGNQLNVNMADVFVNHAGGFVDKFFQLKAGSPAIGAGTGGVDMGAFGGSSPFRLGVTPPIPSITNMQLPATPSGSSMQLKFSTKSN